MSVYFISGIDTDIGKSVAVGMMARDLHARGKRVITMKLVQTGNDGFSEDLDKHRAMMNVPRFPEDEAGLTAPQIFRFPSSPHLAAKLEGRSLPDFVTQFEQLLDRLESAEVRSMIAQYIDFEADVYASGGRITYLANDYLLDIFTDTTERSPTFMLPPFRRRKILSHDEKGGEKRKRGQNNKKLKGQIEKMSHFQ